ncbi:hypothetical protein ACH5RR_021338 [Cinchona calisaya]|uniref:SHSP domain-containing protein n=1 Tax=Cinchona calisaya TaxID=153742 RepID=A0ABD2ZI19_9GENT
MAAAKPASHKYEEFEPSTEIVQEKDCDTILLNVPGFKKDQLRVQLTPRKVLIISGEKEIDANKSIRFQKEFPVSSNYDTTKITAKFERGILYLRQPKLITPEEKQDNKLPAVPEPQIPQKPADTKPQSASKPAKDQPSPQKNVQQKTAETVSTRDDQFKQTNVRDAPQKKQENKEEPKATNEKGVDSTETGNLGKKFQEEKTSFPGDKPEKDSTRAADTTRMENHNKEKVVDVAAKLKTSRRVMNVVLVVLLAIVLGLYSINFFGSFWTTTEN